ncbi:carbonic anhydrase [Angulomicrobium tetraedrale]|uniref:Carbonic anhydrase n=1 Tax=Ancylobacter tetraedralis TaxID=217068 RepID=A0A839Z7U4_9HYPH|nr:carbonic anhydrase [Ancylobacter tetraedralis]MBB3771221.1 carbonic anhydrase [Ancylobacter tetraedralis]
MAMSGLLSRRNLLHAAACGCAAAAAGVGATLAGGSGAFAATYAEKTTLTATQALDRLKAGNAAFVKGGACVPVGGPEAIARLASGQAPFAVVVACSDSRTPPEHLFDARLGELFVIRVAGNTVDDTALGSIEYGVVVLGAPLVLVLGHSECGAVAAAVSMVTEKARFPGSISTMVEPILPAVLRAQGTTGDLVANAVRENVELVLDHVGQASVLISDAVRAGKARLAGGVYDLKTGEVGFLS